MILHIVIAALALTTAVLAAPVETHVKLHWNGRKAKETLTLTLDAPGRLQVVDYREGDMFDIYDHDTYLGELSSANSVPATTLEDASMGQNTLPLESGEHAITVRIRSSRNRAGTAVLRLVPDDHKGTKFVKKKVRSSRSRYDHDTWVNGYDMDVVITTMAFEWTWEDALAGYDHPLYGHPVDIEHTITSTQTVWADPEATRHCKSRYASFATSTDAIPYVGRVR